MIRYIIIVEKYRSDLERTVNFKILEGWEPLGAPFYAKEDTNTHFLFYQAMIKND